MMMKNFLLRAKQNAILKLLYFILFLVSFLLIFFQSKVNECYRRNYKAELLKLGEYAKWLRLANDNVSDGYIRNNREREEKLLILEDNIHTLEKTYFQGKCRFYECSGDGYIDYSYKDGKIFDAGEVEVEHHGYKIKLDNIYAVFMDSEVLSKKIRDDINDIKTEYITVSYDGGKNIVFFYTPVRAGRSYRDFGYEYFFLEIEESYLSLCAWKDSFRSLIWIIFAEVFLITAATYIFMLYRHRFIKPYFVKEFILEKKDLGKVCNIFTMYALADCESSYIVNLSENMFLLEYHDRNLVSSNRNYLRFIRQNVKRFIYADDSGIYLSFFDRNHLLNAFYQGETSLSVDFRRIDEDGKLKWVCDTVCMMKIQEDVFIFVYERDIQKRKISELSLKFKAERDFLTGIYNRSTTERLIRDYIEKNKNIDVFSAFLIIDLDNFKSINDNLGHMIGDKVLVEFAKKMQLSFTKNDIIGRLGGDEFVVFCKDAVSKEYIEEKSRLLNESFVKIKQELSINVDTSGCIGVALFKEHGSDFDTLYRNADSALYFAKYLGKNKTITFDKSFISERGF